MERFWSALVSTSPGMLDLRSQFTGDILNQGATQKHVQALDTKADGEHRLMLFESMLQQSEIRPLAVPIRLVRLLVAACMIKRWVNIGGAAGKNDRVKGQRQVFQVV